MRILVLRASDAAAKTARSLEAEGHQAVLAPVMRIVPTSAALPQKPFDAILATSAHAFGAPEGAPDAFRHRPVFTVGRTTRDAARKAGFRDIRSSDGDAAALVSLLRLTLPRPARLLYIAGRDRKPTVERSLEDAGYTVELFIAYEADPEDRWPKAAVAALSDGGIDAALHFSRRSAEMALTLAAKHHILEALLGLRNLCLSEDVAVPLRAAGATRITVAARPDEACLLDLLRAGHA